MEEIRRRGINSWRHAFLAAGFALVGSWCGLAGAQSSGIDPSGMTEREQQMLEVIQQLEQRVEELEARMQEQPAPDPEAEAHRAAREAETEEFQRVAEERLAAIEEMMEDEFAIRSRTFRDYWDGLPKFETADGAFEVHFNGRIQLDFAWFDQPGDLEFLWDPVAQDIVFADAEDGVDFRRVWFGIGGHVYNNVQWQILWDITDNQNALLDTFVALPDVPYAGSLKVGRFQEPFSLEEWTSNSNITFLERALPNALAPSYNTGFLLANDAYGQRMTWQLALTRDTNSAGNGADDGGHNVIGRVTGLPWYKDEGRKLAHLGLAYSYRNPDGAVRFRSRPEATLAPTFLDTGEIFADTIQLYGGEGAFVYGPFSLQGEYIRADVDTRLRGEATLDGWYVQASYFLTGEHRPYVKSRGIFGNLQPKRNFEWREGYEKGIGAWEIAARYSALDLTDAGVFGGEEQDFTLGVNWYLNPVTRISMNWVRADVDHPLYWGTFDSLVTRFQIRF